MPALNPPSMQIGALMPGQGSLAPVGPSAIQSANPPIGSARILQALGATTSVSGPTNIVQSVTSTQAGSFLVWMVAVNASAAAATGGAPTGWTQIQNQAAATLAVAIYTLPKNPGGITSVTFSSNATATTGGIASWFWEIANVPTGPIGGSSVGFNSNLGSSTAPSTQPVTPALDVSLILVGVGWVLGTATLGSTTAGFVMNAQQSSTAGTTNAALETGTFQEPFGTPVLVNFGGTLSASAQWGGLVLVLSTTGSGQFSIEPNLGFNVDQLGAIAQGGTGITGWAIGGTKPGGAGSGQ